MTKSSAKSQLLTDERFMRAALREADRAALESEVPVGAVLVREGRVLARAHNRPIHLHDPSAHAEILVLRRAGRKSRNYRLEGCDLYVTIEPCAMCAGAIVQARLRRTVYGAPDPKAGACGTALRVLNHRKLNHRVEITRGVLATECASVIQEFFRMKRNNSNGTGAPAGHQEARY
jgi:tRNA(adenine34) deaminase